MTGSLCAGRGAGSMVAQSFTLSYHCALSNTTNMVHHSHQTLPALRIGCLLQPEYLHMNHAAPCNDGAPATTCTRALSCAPRALHSSHTCAGRQRGSAAARLRERPRLPRELAGHGGADVCAEQRLSIHLVVHVHADEAGRVAGQAR